MLTDRLLELGLIEVEIEIVYEKGLLKLPKVYILKGKFHRACFIAYLSYFDLLSKLSFASMFSNAKQH